MKRLLYCLALCITFTSYAQERLESHLNADSSRRQNHQAENALYAAGHFREKCPMGFFAYSDIGSDEKVYQWLKMPGSYGGKSGVFEYIRNPITNESPEEYTKRSNTIAKESIKAANDVAMRLNKKCYIVIVI